MIDCILGLDIGTSGVKAGLFDAHGAQLASAISPLALYVPHPGWAEQEPEDYWRGACQAIAQVLGQVEDAHVAAIGLAGQCPGQVLVNSSRQALGRAIIWRDQRAVEEARQLSQLVPPDLALACLGTSLTCDPGSPLARLLWLKRHRTHDWQDAESVLQPKDFIACHLTGRPTTDRNSAYCLADPQTGRYEQRLFDRLEIEVEKLPPALLPEEIVGQVSAAASQQTGLKTGTPVVAGTIDAYCDNLAGGVVCRRRAVNVAGSSEIISLATDRAVSASGIYAAQIGGAHFLCGPTQAGGGTLRWFTNAFFPEYRQDMDCSLREKEAAAAPAGCQGLVFLPYLNGERTPLWDAHARGCFFGITFSHNRSHFTRAVYEGLGCAVRHVLELSEEAAGEKADEIVICGGGSQRQFSVQIKADILQRQVRPAAAGSTGCLGAAMLAAVGVGIFPGLEGASPEMVVLKDPVEPDRSTAEVYDEIYGIYRSLYPVLKPLFGPPQGPRGSIRPVGTQAGGSGSQAGDTRMQAGSSAPDDR